MRAHLVGEIDWGAARAAVTEMLGIVDQLEHLLAERGTPWEKILYGAQLAAVRFRLEILEAGFEADEERAEYPDLEFDVFFEALPGGAS